MCLPLVVRYKESTGARVTPSDEDADDDDDDDDVDDLLLRAGLSSGRVSLISEARQGRIAAELPAIADGDGGDGAAHGCPTHCYTAGPASAAAGSDRGRSGLVTCL